jgi:signal transduction histidine kinase
LIGETSRSSDLLDAKLPSMPSRPRSLRWWLTALVASVAIPVLALVVLISLQQVRREQAEARVLALQMAKASAARIREGAAESRILLTHMAESAGRTGIDAGSCIAFFSAIDALPRYADIMLFDAQGQVVCHGNPLPEHDRVLAPARRWVEKQIRARALPEGRPAIRQFESHSLSVLSARIANDRGTLVLLEFVEAIGHDALIPGAVVTVIDRENTIIARSEDSERWTGHNVGALAIVRIAQQKGEGTAEGSGVEGIRRQYGFARIPESGWTVYAGLPNETIVDPVREMLINSLVAGLGVLALVVIMTLVVERAIRRPVHGLIRAAHAVEQGSYARAAEVGGPTELTTLTSAFNRMIDRREQADLQMHVGERKLKALHERLLLAQEEERKRIARELHDDLGQSITALKMDCIGLLELSPRTAKTDSISRRILTTLDSTVSAVQRISSELRPSVLDDLGLVAAIQEEARLFELRSGIECEVSVSGDVPDDPETATTIYRIVQEALTNVTRHANATRTEIRLRQREHELLLEIRDDGRGVTSDEAGDPLALGLIGMRERAALIGGTVQIEGVEDRGTIVSARLPGEPRMKLS